MQTINGQFPEVAGAVRGQAQARTLLMALLGLGAGLALGAVWFHQPETSSGATAALPTHDASGLSDTTRNVLQRLHAPIEIRFYSLLDQATASEPLRALSGRVSTLLKAYESAANGKLKITQISSPTYANNNAAAKDGVREFNGDQGNPSFLGIAVVRGEARQSLAWLAPDWEPALECDLTRAISAVADAGAQSQPVPPPTPAATAALESVKTSLTNLDAVSFEQGAQILREAALAEFTQATQEMDAKVKQAQQLLLQAKASQSAPEQQATLQKLQQLQAEQSQKLKEIAARSQAQLQALQQYKTVAR
jgi:hypothetical protein